MEAELTTAPDGIRRLSSVDLARTYHMQNLVGAPSLSSKLAPLPVIKKTARVCDAEPFVQSQRVTGQQGSSFRYARRWHRDVPDELLQE